MGRADVVRVGSRRERVAADAWIQRSSTVPSQLSWRAAELTSPHERNLLARSLRGVVDGPVPSRVPGAAPLNRVVVRPHAELLLRTADRLDDLERPVAARGILEVQWLLADPDSPLYGDDSEPEDIRKAVVAALDLLDIHL